ncbi:scf e3 ubiquitin ligase complex f-box protein grra [Chrysochromulina tobinii]|uniref:Scf e3 ubiquitin ligase complex f-box protein grra n=1 Tax=Chrysochromulina tobinii TaxID=1460289 RepID=A0A0M0JSD2_9EUKA|nr:scf e3 ubiquitin ligase complex f-box protein grra [Chrysochromulina tobinii]|eukprot:KOO29242.1 scf e3 ubiquitin ligase complex f-box protein grra [Chrysochromulina sp. CCMP291]
MILDDPDLLSLVLSQMGIELETVDVAHPQQLRSLLRLVCRSVCGHLDAIVTTYRDCRRSRDATLRVLPLDVSELATLALRRLGPLRCLQLEGLNDDALEMVLEVAADPKYGGRLENLSLQRGVFSGTCAYTSSLRLPDWEDAPTMLLPRLRELELGGCGFLTDAGLEALTAAAAPTLTRLRVTVNALLRRPRLTLPHLQHCTIAICANLTDEAVHDLCAGSPQLAELSLWRCTALRTPPVRGASLTSLNLCECTSLHDRALRPLAASRQSSLTTLDVSDILTMNDALLSAACASAPKIRHLDFSRSGHAVIAPSVGGPCLTHLIGTRCEALADETVSAACDTSPRLSTLMLALCGSLRSPRIHGALITDLNMSGCSMLQDSAVTYACMHCPRLSRLSLSLCGMLASPIVRGPALKRIELSHCERLCRPSLGGPQIEQLIFAGCTALEDDALEFACKDCPRLLKLTIDGCAGLVAPRLKSATLHSLSCQHLAHLVVEAATERSRLPALKHIVSEDAHAIEEIE